MLKFFTTDLRRNITKIICLTVGMAVGFLFVAKIYFEQTFDSFFPDIDRLYCITESFIFDGNYTESTCTPGGTAEELRQHFPQIEKATRMTDLCIKTSIELEDGRMFEIDGIMLADTEMFNILHTDVTEGDPRSVLDVDDQVMIPRSLAEKIGDNVLGLRFSSQSHGDSYKMTIAGVYEDFPLNSTIGNKVYLSLSSIPKLMNDGRENLLGNDVYYSYVKLAPGVNVEELQPKLMEYLKRKLPPMAEVMSYKIWLRPLKGMYSSRDQVKIMSWMLGLLAFVLLMCASLNYLLIVIGQLTGRSKEMAIRKCYGTDRKRIFMMVLGESLFFLVISLGLAVLLAFALSGLCRELLGYSAEQLFSTGRIWLVEGTVALILFIITGIVPAFIYTATPVTHAFRSYTYGRKVWKLTLLSIQFFVSGLLACLLVLVWRQYSLVTGISLGYEYDNVAHFSFNKNTSPERKATVVRELGKLPFVDKVATASLDPFFSAAGLNVWVEGQYDNQVNVADLDRVNPDFFDVMGIKFIQGNKFGETADSAVNEVIVDERFIDVLRNGFGIEDSDITGKTFYMSGHGTGDNSLPVARITGVTETLRRGGFENDSHDFRASLFLPGNGAMNEVFVRFSTLTYENLEEAQNMIDNLVGPGNITISPYKLRVDTIHRPIRRFGSSVMVVGIVIILIALIGLIGYVADEVNRHSKEIAVRKVNGTSSSRIVSLFCVDILRVAVPSLIAGGVTAIVIGQRWLSQFTDRVSVSPISMLICLLLLIILITGVVILNSLRVARSNPVNFLRSE